MSITLNGKNLEVLIEQCQDFEFLSEENKDGKKHHYIQGIFLSHSIKNKNNRIYPAEVMRQEVGRYIREMVDDNRAVGELGHPEGPTINPERVSHRILQLVEDGNNYIGRALIHNTPFGNIVKTFIDEGTKFGVSSRAVGSLRNVNGVDQVQNDFRLATAADIVMDPSAPEAFVRGIVENKEYILAEGLITESSFDKWQKEIKKATLVNLREVELNNYHEFLKEIDQKFGY